MPEPIKMLMTGYDLKSFIIGAVFASLMVGGFGIWTEAAPETLGVLSYEDGWIESLTAGFCAVAGMSFIFLAFTYPPLKGKKKAFTLCWAAFCLLIAAEEISWGQRIFNIETPDYVSEINWQNELNIHNVIIGGFTLNSRRVFTLVTFMIGITFPAIALFPRGKRIIQNYSFPVMPFIWIPVMVGSFVYMKYYYFHGQNFTNEIKELIFAAALLGFGLHGAIRPPDVFRLARCNLPNSRAP